MGIAGVPHLRAVRALDPHHHYSMSLRLQLEYWKDGSWFVGRLPQVPGVFSQGATLEELEENIRDAYRMMLPLDAQSRVRRQNSGSEQDRA